MKTFIRMRLASLVGAAAFIAAIGIAEIGATQERLDPLDQKFSINLQDSELSSALSMIAARAGLKLHLGKGVQGKVSYQKPESTIREALEAITAKHGLDYSISGSILTVSPVQSEGAAGSAATRADQGVYQIPIKYLNAADISAKLAPVLGKDDKLVVDDKTNNLILVGSLASLRRARQLVAILDVIPQQIVIETQIVETSNQFLRDIGVSVGDLTDKSLNNTSEFSGFTDAPMRGTPNAAFKYMIGTLDGRALDLRITAAETEGDAKVISRPKVVTVNNKAARIESGVSFHVKTLTAVSTSNGTGGASGISGGISTVNAGLVLEILPSIVADDLVNLSININNSQPDEGTAVDGIPGVVNNAANTSVMIRSGQTAVIAGLVKQSKSDSSGKVPFLSEIPILGFLFKSISKAERNNEMVIFITPAVVRTIGLERASAPAGLAQIGAKTSP